MRVSFLCVVLFGLLFFIQFGNAEEQIPKEQSRLLSIFCSNQQWYQVIDTGLFKKILVEPVSKNETEKIPAENISNDVVFCHSPEYGDVLGWVSLLPGTSIMLDYSKKDLLGTYVMCRKNGVWQLPIKTPYSGIKAVTFGKDGRLHMVWLDYSVKKLEGIDVVYKGKLMYGFYDGNKFSEPQEINPGLIVDPVPMDFKSIFLRTTEDGHLVLLFQKQLGENNYYITKTDEKGKWSTPILLVGMNYKQPSNAIINFYLVTGCDLLINHNELFLSVNFVEVRNGISKIKVFKLDWKGKIKPIDIITVPGQSSNLFLIKDNVGIMYSEIINPNDFNNRSKYIRALLIDNQNHIYTIKQVGLKEKMISNGLLYVDENKIGIGFSQEDKFQVERFDVDSFLGLLLH